MYSNTLFYDILVEDEIELIRNQIRDLKEKKSKFDDIERYNLPKGYEGIGYDNYEDDEDYEEGIYNYTFMEDYIQSRIDSLENSLSELIN